MNKTAVYAQIASRFPADFMSKLKSDFPTYLETRKEGIYETLMLSFYLRYLALEAKIIALRDNTQFSTVSDVITYFNTYEHSEEYQKDLDAKVTNFWANAGQQDEEIDLIAMLECISPNVYFDYLDTLVEVEVNSAFLEMVFEPSNTGELYLSPYFTEEELGSLFYLSDIAETVYKMLGSDLMLEGYMDTFLEHFKNMTLTQVCEVGKKLVEQGAIDEDQPQLSDLIKDMVFGSTPTLFDILVETDQNETIEGKDSVLLLYSELEREYKREAYSFLPKPMHDIFYHTKFVPFLGGLILDGKLEEKEVQKLSLLGDQFFLPSVTDKLAQFTYSE